MAQAVQQKNNMVLSFVSAFAGMVVAIPVAVTVSVMVVKASFADNQTQLANQVSQLSAQVNDPHFIPVGSTSATVQTSGNVAVATNGACVGDVQPVAATGTSWNGGHAVKSAYKPYSYGHISHSFNTTVHNTTTNSSWTYTDSYNTVGSYNHSATTNHSNQTNIASNNTVTGNTVNSNSNNNSGNTTTTNTAVNTTVNTNSNNTNSGNITTASGNTTNLNSNNTNSGNVLSGNTTNVDSNNTHNHDSNNVQVGAFQNI